MTNFVEKSMNNCFQPQWNVVFALIMVSIPSLKWKITEGNISAWLIIPVLDSTGTT